MQLNPTGVSKKKDAQLTMFCERHMEELVGSDVSFVVIASVCTFAPNVGLEPTTTRLRVLRSAD